MAAEQVHRRGAQPAPGAIALDGVADLLAGGQAKTNGDASRSGALPFVMSAYLQDQSWRDMLAPCARDRQKLRATQQAADAGAVQARRLGQARRYQALRTLRPWARRRAITLRPPGVDMRARKPWRRLRTILLGWKVRFTARYSINIGQNKNEPCRIRGLRSGVNPRFPATTPRIGSFPWRREPLYLRSAPGAPNGGRAGEADATIFLCTITLF